MTRNEHIAEHPDFPFLSSETPAVLLALLKPLGLIAPGESLACLVRAGEGNMNLTLRATLCSGRTLIVKQSRPWVEKYDFISAPWDRANTESLFYRKISTVPALADAMPRFLAADPAACLLILEDLGPSSDLSTIYTSATPLPGATLASLAGYLRTLHDAFRDRPDAALANPQMRSLNHAYIFDLPLKTPPEKLDAIAPGLAAATATLTASVPYLDAVSAAAHSYLTASGPCLLHGDFFPGSWLQTASGVKVIDPEFTHFGPAEFDVGVCLAHLALAAQPAESPATFLSAYGQGLDGKTLATTAAIEVMRRLIGVAQLPLPPQLDKPALLRKSLATIESENVLTLFQ